MHRHFLSDKQYISNYKLAVLILLTAVFTAVLIACNEEPPLATEKNFDQINARKDFEINAETARKEKPIKMVPHKGHIFFYPTLVEPTDDPLIVHITYEGEGIASHFGHFTETGEYLLHSDTDGTPLYISDVSATRTTANGDQVFLDNVTGVISLTGDPDHPMTLEGDFNYNNGTGRFKNVSGSIHWLAIGNPDGSALSNFEGTISTVGSKTQ